MYDHGLFVRTLSEFTSDLVRAYDGPTMLQHLAERVKAVLGLSGCGVSLASGGRLRFVVAVPTRISQLEQVQDATGQGPCADAYRTGRIVTLDDVVDAPDAWGGYVHEAERVGIRAVAGVPMKLENESIGALNLYDASPRTWIAEDLAAARGLADMATGYLVNASKLRQQEELSEQLTRALRSRVRIEQAKGVLAQAGGISVDEAFQRLRAWARSHNQTLSEVAEQVVHRGLRP